MPSQNIVLASDNQTSELANGKNLNRFFYDFFSAVSEKRIEGNFFLFNEEETFEVQTKDVQMKKKKKKKKDFDGLEF